MFCHFRISVAGAPPRRVAFELRPDKCPNTCANFAALCRSSATAVRRSKREGGRAPPTYRGTIFHRIIPGFMIQGGDYENFDGTGGQAAPSSSLTKFGESPTFPDEDFSIPHDMEGVLSMANRGRDTNGSQFFVTLGRAPHLDGKHVAFGRVIEGMEVMRDASRVDTEGGGRPVAMQRVSIADCGLGTGRDDDDDGDGDGGGGGSGAGAGRGKRRSGSRDERRSRRRDDDDDDDDDGGGNKSSRKRRRGTRDEDDGSGGRSGKRHRRRKRSRAEKDDRGRRKHRKEGKTSRRRRDASSSSSLSSPSTSSSSSSSSSSSGDERRRRGRSSRGRDARARR